MMLLVVGCFQPKPIRLGGGTAVSERKAIVFFADGVNRDVYRRMLAAGQLPNINKYLVQRGTSVDHAVTVAPSITYAVNTSFVTGMVPGHHGIVSNSFFDRDRLFLTSYLTAKTYRDTDDQYRAATIYEILDNKFSVSIQTPIRRGVYQRIDNWASSGILWFFANMYAIDSLVADRFDLIEQTARRSQRWPDLIFAYFPASDEIGHRYGPDSQRYHNCLVNMDKQIGRICAALDQNGLLESTYLAFVVDHGMTPTPRKNHVHVADILARDFPLRIAQNGPDERTVYDDRVTYFKKYDAVLINGGYRLCNFYLKNDADWSQLAQPGQLTPLADRLCMEKGICLLAYRDRTGVVVQNNRGRAVVERLTPEKAGPLDQKQYRYRVIEGNDPLNYAEAIPQSPVLDGNYHDGRLWLEQTAGAAFPDLPVQISELFDSRHAGDLTIFAAEGWAFSPENAAGHGSVLASDMVVPMIFAGPNIKAGATLPFCRNVDLAPTLVDMLGGAEKQCPPFDGKSVLPQLQSR
jgi:hypothetical protein